MNDVLAVLVMLAAILASLWVCGHPEYFPDEPRRRRRDD